MQQLSSSFLFIIRYILNNNPKQERFQIDKHLIDLGYNPDEVDRAWKVVEAGQGWTVLQTNKLPANKDTDKDTEARGGCLLFCLGSFLTLAAFIGWGSSATWLADRLNFPLLITLPVFLAGNFFTFKIYFSTYKAFMAGKRSAWWGALAILVQLFLFYGALRVIQGPPNPPTLFATYPNAAKVALPENSPYPFGMNCLNYNLAANGLTVKEAYATNDPPQKIQDFYENQARNSSSKMLNPITGEGNSDIFIFKIRGNEQSPDATRNATCYVGSSLTQYIPANGVMYFPIKPYQSYFVKLLPDLPENYTYLIIVFNGILTLY